MDKLSGKVALITGGTSGIGASVARLFAAEGAIVTATGSSAASVAAARTASPDVEHVAVNAASIEAGASLVADLAEKRGRIDLLVISAGAAPYAPLDAVDAEHFDTVFDTNVRGAFFLIQAAARVMPEGGAIVLIASIGHAMGLSNQSVYSASKAALRSLGRTLAAELAGRGIRVNTISPGPVATPIWAKASGADPEQVKAMQDQIATKVPLGRIGLPEDIAAAALYLAADAPFVTGIDLPVDGGLLGIGDAGALRLS